jgi:hypothetical protein
VTPILPGEARLCDGLETDIGFASKQRAHDQEIQIGIGLETDNHSALREQLTPSHGYLFVKGRVGVAGGLALLVITLTLVGKIGVHFGAMTEIESQRAVDLFQRQERIAFLDTFR